MRIAVFGATGMIGSRIVAEGARRGHDVIALSRSGDDVPGARAARRADMADAEDVAAAAADADVVISATGPSRTGRPHEDWLHAVECLVRRAVGTRLLVVGGAGTLEVDGVRLLDAPDFPAAYHAEAVTQAEALSLLRGAERADWTVVSPAPEIGPGERAAEYASGADSPAGGRISAETFAVAILDEVERPAHAGERFTVADL
ncbi:MULTISPECIES: NAD(P)-dependent oxidoreductase [Brevibacterium]|uniref:NAD(P)H-binding protein n=1 Tax=Brevibacterium salitolerans TaxID=1403566 RepID=A0ABN2WRJ9_9MICO|nr:NAD(P)H-binding protein [Brevibacterium sp.]